MYVKSLGWGSRLGSFIFPSDFEGVIDFVSINSDAQFKIHLRCVYWMQARVGKGARMSIFHIKAPSKVSVQGIDNLCT